MTRRPSRRALFHDRAAPLWVGSEPTGQCPWRPSSQPIPRRNADPERSGRGLHLGLPRPSVGYPGKVKESASMPRIEPISDKSDVPAEYHSVVDGVLARFGRIRGPFSVLLHSPRLAERLLGVGNYFRRDRIVADDDKSLAILVATR